MHLIKFLIFSIKLTLATEFKEINDVSFMKEIDMFLEIIENINSEIYQTDITNKHEKIKNQYQEQKKKQRKEKPVKYKKFEDIFMSFSNIKKLMTDLHNQFNFLIKSKFDFNELKTNEIRKNISCLSFEKTISSNINNLKCIRALMILRFLIKGEERSNILKRGVHFDKNNYYNIFEAHLHKIPNLKDKYNTVPEDKRIINLSKKFANKKAIMNKFFSCIIAETIFEASKRLKSIKASIEIISNWHNLYLKTENDEDTKIVEKKDLKKIKSKTQKKVTSHAEETKGLRTMLKNADLLFDKLKKSADIISNELTYNLICDNDFFEKALPLFLFKADQNLKERIENNVYSVFGCMVLCGEEKNKYTQILDVLNRYDNLVKNLYINYNISKFNNNSINNKKEIKMGSLDECLNSFSNFKQYWSNINFINRRNYGNFNYCLYMKIPTPSDIIISIFGEYNMLFILFKELEIKFFNLKARKEKDYKCKLNVIQNTLLLLGNCYFDQIERSENLNINFDKSLNKYTEKIFEELHLRGNLAEKIKKSFKTIYMNELEKSLNDKKNDKKWLILFSIIIKSDCFSLKKISEIKFIQIVKYFAFIFDIKYDDNDINKLLENVEKHIGASEEIKNFYHYYWLLMINPNHYKTFNHKISICPICEINFNMINTVFSNKLEQFRGKDENIVDIHKLINIVNEYTNSTLFNIIRFNELSQFEKNKNVYEKKNMTAILINKAIYASLNDGIVKDDIINSLEDYINYNLNQNNNISDLLTAQNQEAHKNKLNFKAFYDERFIINSLISEDKSLTDDFMSIDFKDKIYSYKQKVLINKSLNILDKTSMSLLKLSCNDFYEQSKVTISKKNQEIINKLINIVINVINTKFVIKAEKCTHKPFNDQKFSKLIKNLLKQRIFEDLKKDSQNNTFNNNIAVKKYKNLFINSLDSIFYYKLKARHYLINLNLYCLIEFLNNYIESENNDENKTSTNKKTLSKNCCFFMGVVTSLYKILMIDNDSKTYVHDINEREDITVLLAYLLNFSHKKLIKQ